MLTGFASDLLATSQVNEGDVGDAAQVQQGLVCQLIAACRERRERLSCGASAEEQTILYADIDLVAARSALVWNNLNDLPRDRRSDLYDAMLGYRLHPALAR